MNRDARSVLSCQLERYSVQRHQLVLLKYPSTSIIMSSAWDYIGLFTGTFLIFASEWRLSKFGEEAADNRKGSRTNVSHCTPTQAVLVVAYFLVVSRLHDDPPSFLSGLGYLLFGFLIVCFVVGADSKSMSKDFHMMFRICVSPKISPSRALSSCNR